MMGTLFCPVANVVPIASSPLSSESVSAPHGLHGQKVLSNVYPESSCYGLNSQFFALS